MGLFKTEGDPALVLVEEMAEATQIIMKKFRFEGKWNEIPPGKDTTRWEDLNSEMADVLFQWERLKEKWKEENIARRIRNNTFF